MLIGNPFESFFPTGLLGSVLSTILYVILISIIMVLFAYFFAWFERKMIAKAQYRHGPTYVGKYGLLQNFADLLKLLAKEVVIPENANRMIIVLAPILLVALNIFLIFLIPFSPFLQATNLGLGLLIIFTVLGFTPILIFLVGFSTGNKFADISAQRSVLVLISYELPMIIIIASLAIITHSYSIGSLMQVQSNEYLFELMPIGLFVFFVTMLAELERPPFDIREADSELIAGWLTDISGPYYALSLLLDYTRMFLGGLLISIIFFGGWLGPSIIPSFAWLIIKAFIVVFFITLIRITTVRMRIDRILRFGWVWLMPLALINLIITFVIFK